MQLITISLKNIAKLLVLAVAVLFYFIVTTPTHAQVGIPAGGVELDGYAWSSNIGWISMNCRTGGVTGNDICATSNYKATVSATGAVTGYAWSSNIGWIRFGGLSDFPSSPGTTAVNARMTGTYPDLTFEGWVRACAGDNMGAGCTVVAATSTPSSVITWTQTGTVTSNFYTTHLGGGNSSNIVYGNGTWVGIGNRASRVLRSTDGSTWSEVAVPGGYLIGLAHGNNTFVGVLHNDNQVGTTRAITSPDGITWTLRATPIDAYFKGITYANGLFVAVACGSGTSGCNDTAVNRVMTSPDGITWTARTAPTGRWNSVVYAEGLFVAVSEGGSNAVMTSPDGITWTARTTPGFGFWSIVKHGNGRFVAVASNGGGPQSTVMTSPDGITWTFNPPSVEGSFRGLEFFGTLFVACWFDINSSGPPYYISTSPDGIVWTRQTYFEPANTSDLYAIGVGGGKIILGSGFVGPYNVYSGEFATSTSYTGTGWDGWISLRSTTAPTHSVVMSSTGASATSYAWGSSVMGWINFDDVRFLAPTATLSGTNCSIPAGASTCNSSFSWNIQNATSPNLRNSTRSVTYTTTAAGTTTPYAITSGANTVQARDNNTVLASVVVTGTCAAGTDFANGTTCETTVVPAPVISITTNKTIARTGDTVLVSWTMNPSPIASGTCSVSGPGMPASVTTTGSQTSNALSSKIRFTLTCTGAYGTVRANADVEIIPKASEV